MHIFFGKFVAAGTRILQTSILGDLT